VPLIANACAHFVCRLTDARVAGDHTLFIGAVEEFSSTANAPLIFYEGGYSELRPEPIS
jgi:flavin reductase (DIM6/NTAB) family NADH-FMN oxidoreductase RutF